MDNAVAPLKGGVSCVFGVLQAALRFNKQFGLLYSLMHCYQCLTG